MRRRRRCFWAFRPSFPSIWLAVMLLILPALHAYTLPDTGQTKCYDNTEEIPCPAPGEPFYGQDAHYQGTPPAYRDNGDGSVTDLNTGLVWEQGDSQNDNSRFWHDAVTYCDALNLGSQTDWRLPSKRELISILDYSRFNPTIDTTYFPSLPPSPYYWSATTVTNNPDYTDHAWAGFLYSGYILAYQKYVPAYVRCVRGDPIPEGSFTDNGDGTVTDTTTSLMWQKADDGVLRSWMDSLAYCQESPVGGHTDWRLPNARELETTADVTRSNPAIYPIFQSSVDG